jgi:hypothetical protein
LMAISPRARVGGIAPLWTDFFGMMVGFGMGLFYSAEILNSPAWRGAM